MTAPIFGLPPVEKGGNPCIQAYGPGPRGRECGECRLIEASVVKGGQQGTRYRCQLRSPSHNQKVRWPACGRFEKRPR